MSQKPKCMNAKIHLAVFYHIHIQLCQCESVAQFIQKKILYCKIPEGVNLPSNIRVFPDEDLKIRIPVRILTYQLQIPSSGPFCFCRSDRFRPGTELGRSGGDWPKPLCHVIHCTCWGRLLCLLECGIPTKKRF